MSLLFHCISHRVWIVVLIAMLVLQPIYSPCCYSKTKEEIKTEINKLLQHRYLKNVDYSIKVLSTTNQEILLNIGEKKALTPASTTKLLTTACALNKLTNDFQISTIICSDKEIRNGTLPGNIYLKGYGNPLLTSANLEEMAFTLSLRGLHIVGGDIIIDDSYFDSKLFRDQWVDDNENSYEEQPVSAVTVDNNTLYVSISSSDKINSQPEIYVYPEMNDLKIVNNAKTANIKRRKETVSLFLKETNGTYTLTVSGQIGKSRKKYLDAKIKDPTIFCGAQLKTALAMRGIIVTGKVKTGRLPKENVILVKHDLPLENLISVINKNSDNFCADQLLKIIGAEFSKKEGSAKNGINAIYSYLKENKIDTTELKIYDGSGLSRKNKLSSNTLAQLLYSMANNEKVFYSFYNSLSCAGVDGTLKHRMSNIESADVRGKTGTLRDVTSIAGYVTSIDNELLIFIIFMDNVKFGIHELRSMQDKIVSLLSEFSRSY